MQLAALRSLLLLLLLLLQDEVKAAAVASEAGKAGWDRGRALRVGGAALAGGAAMYMSAGLAGVMMLAADNCYYFSRFCRAGVGD